MAAVQEAVAASSGRPNRVYSYLSEASQGTGRLLGIGRRAIDLTTSWVRVNAETPEGLATATAARRLCAAKEVGIRIVDEVYGSKQIFPPQFELVAHVEPTDKPIDLRPLVEATPTAIGLVENRDHLTIGIALQHGPTTENPQNVPAILPITHEWFVTHPASREDVETALRFVANGVRAQTA